MDDDHDHIPFPFTRNGERTGKVHGDGMPSLPRDSQRLVKTVAVAACLISLTDGA